MHEQRDTVILPIPSVRPSVRPMRMAGIVYKRMHIVTFFDDLVSK